MLVCHGKQNQKQADRGFLHHLPFSLLQHFDNLHGKEEESVLGGANPGGGDRKGLRHNVLCSS